MSLLTKDYTYLSYFKIINKSSIQSLKRILSSDFFQSPSFPLCNINLFLSADSSFRKKTQKGRHRKNIVLRKINIKISPVALVYTVSALFQYSFYQMDSTGRMQYYKPSGY